ncbi:MAG: competence/damage-inducible protein A [Prevotellaceae bacterium]|jgi:nicotinamide-nucleotide amidase|nr:competence/damage-inducible protein A [Prevotellaceae bacterium]
MRKNQVEIITIGDEILIGQIVDTNSAWMARELNNAGFEVHRTVSVHDNDKQIAAALNEALDKVDIVLITGGIGPTKDDMTKQTLCTFFETELVYNESVYQNIVDLFANRNLQINELTKNQAYVPKCSDIIQNKAGTAPILWFNKSEKVVVAMPGVPYEMQLAMSNDILPRLLERFRTSVLIHKTIQVYGYSESALALKIADWENALPQNIRLAYLPNLAVIKLRLSGVSDEASGLEFTLNRQIESLKEMLGSAIFAYEDVSMEQLIADLLSDQHKTIATAESCTGGYVAHRITAIPGSSRYFRGAVTAYSNDLKISLLGVDRNDLEHEGAVSKTIVEQMAKGARTYLKTDIAIATSGIAGPDGGTDEKPVGSVWISVSTKNETRSRLFRFGNIRNINIQRATQAAFLMLREMLVR